MRSVILVSLLFLVGYAGCLRAADTSVVAPAEAAKRVADGKAVLIDVREPAEWAETGVAAPAALLPRRCSRSATSTVTASSGRNFWRKTEPRS
jgi:3-mercaptopyruvate sulfurtransferase SseA